MKIPSILTAALLLCLLCGCTSLDDLKILPPETPSSATAGSSAPTAGRYVCTALQEDGQAINLMDKWVELYEDGTLLLSLYGSPDRALWTVEGDSLSILMDGSVIGKGTLRGDRMELKIMDLSGTFQLQSETVITAEDPPPVPDAEEQQDGQEQSDQPPAGQPQPEQQPEQPQPEPEEEKTGGVGGLFSIAPAEDGVFACYTDLYYVDYPKSRYSVDPARMTDLRSSDGTQIWITRLDTPERVDLWLSNYASEEYGARFEGYETAEWTVAGYPAFLILYEEEPGSWHSEVLVNFGGDMGSGGRAMYAAYFIFSGASREAVWGRDAQDIVNSLRLGYEAESSKY